MAVDKLEWSKLTADATPLTPPMIQKKTLYSQCIFSSNNGTGTWMYPGMAVDELERFSEIEKKILRPKHVIPISTKMKYFKFFLSLSICWFQVHFRVIVITIGTNNTLRTFLQ
jgi:hypothetical protein